MLAAGAATGGAVAAGGAQHFCVKTLELYKSIIKNILGISLENWEIGIEFV